MKTEIKSWLYIRILVVDDEVTIQKTMAAIISKFGHSVTVTGSAEEAIALLRENTYDLIITDMLLPDKPGTEIIKRAREINPNTEAVIITGMPGYDSAVQTLRSGALEYLTKPVIPETLLQIIQKVSFQKARQEGRRKLQRAGKWQRKYLEKLIEKKSAELDISQNQLENIKRALDESAIVVISDSEGNITYANRTYCEITGYSASELIGSKNRIVQSGHHTDDFYDNLWKTILSGQIWKGEILDRKKDGTLFWLEATIVPFITNNRVEQFIGIHRDITDRKRHEEKYHYLAYHDILTDLPNRTWVMEKLYEILATLDGSTEKVLSIISLDLDRFSSINDAFGYDVGDDIIINVARRLSLLPYCKVARIGADEFLLFFVHTKKADLERVLMEMHDMFEKPIEFRGNDLNSSEFILSASAGVSQAPANGDRPEILIRNAETAMHKAKSLGRNSILFFDESMKSDSLKRISLEGEMHYALKNNEFFLVFQPKINLRTGKITGMEALIRWQKRNGELVSPGNFIPLAEESGMIIPIGDLVIEKAAATLRKWLDLGIPARIAVNLSPRQFNANGLCERIAFILAKYDVSPDLLEMEITENAAMESIERALDVFNTISRMGIQISLDDFGTGYSSMSYLRRYPIHSLKIDQSFLQTLNESDTDRSIVQAIIAMARALNIQTIAEGIEDEQTYNTLLELGCDEVQGYYISKPICETDAEKLWLASL